MIVRTREYHQTTDSNGRPFAILAGTIVTIKSVSRVQIGTGEPDARATISAPGYSLETSADTLAEPHTCTVPLALLILEA
jgi:hypothetical protein